MLCLMLLKPYWGIPVILVLLCSSNICPESGVNFVDNVIVPDFFPLNLISKFPLKLFKLPPFNSLTNISFVSPTKSLSN